MPGSLDRRAGSRPVVLAAVRPWPREIGVSGGDARLLGDTTGFAPPATRPPRGQANSQPFRARVAFGMTR